MRIEKQSGFRELNAAEISQVSGGDQYITYFDTDGALITERWSDDGNQFLGLTADYATDPSQSYDFSDLYITGQMGYSLFGISGGYTFNSEEDGIFIGLSQPGPIYNVGVSTTADIDGWSFDYGNLSIDLDDNTISVNAVPGTAITYTASIPWASVEYLNEDSFWEGLIQSWPSFDFSNILSSSEPVDSDPPPLQGSQTGITPQQ